MSTIHLTDYSYRVLILGDGNFSFSSCFVRSLTSSHYSIHCTSFDSHSSLQTKYPESAHHLGQVQSESNTLVSHDVDATSLHKYDLGSFNAIIFNFPHLGIEDCLLHASLLAHVIHSTKSSLCTEILAGALYISLSKDQCERWKLMEMAAKNGMVMTNRMPFTSRDISGYETKRHHNDKSFEARIKDCVCYQFRDAAFAHLELSENCFQLLLDECRKSQMITTPLVGSRNKGTKPIIKKRKTKVALATEGKYRRILEDDSASFECGVCHRVFVSEQGVVTHCYVEHILGNGSTSEVQCEECLRKFPHSKALGDHTMTMHVCDVPKVMSRRSDSLKPKGSFTDTEDPEHVCLICAASFTNADDLSVHLEEGILPLDIDAELPCLICGRLFRDERALGQHSIMVHSSQP